MISTILVPTDGSEHAAKAVGFAGDLAGKYGAKIHLVHVVPDTGTSNIPPDVRSYARLEHVEATERDLIKSIAEEILLRAETQAREHGAGAVESTIALGAPAEQTLKLAGQMHADLIVMGSRGLGDLKGLLMGSVSHKVSQLAPCTCITVK